MINLKSSFTPKIFFTLCLAALALAGCQDPMSGSSYDGREGSFSISIGAVARQVLSWDDSTEISSLVHTITLTGGPDADIKHEGVKFGQTANFTVASGRWTISVYAYHDGVLKAVGSANVDIKPGPNGAIPIKMGTISVTGVKITPAALSLNVGETAILTAEITPANAVNKNLTWASSDDAVATVSNGTVSAISAGTATITVTTKDGAKTADCAVTVSPLVNDIPVTFDSVTANGDAAQTTTQLSLTFDKAITGLSAADISVSGVPGVIKGALSGSGTAYTLPISGFTTGGNLSVAVEKSGYTISGSPQTTAIYYYTAPANVPVTFSGVSANGSPNQTTTQLTLTFSQAITGLSSGDITLSGISNIIKGTLGGSGPTYTLPISGFTTGGNLSVAVEKSGYTISGSPQTTAIYYYTAPANVPVTFSGVTANGSPNQTTTQLTLTFDKAITGLSASNITLNGVKGVTTGTLSGSGTTYTLPISGFTASGDLSVDVSSPSGYNVTGSPRSVTIYYYTSTGGGSTISGDTIASGMDVFYSPAINPAGVPTDFGYYPIWDNTGNATMTSLSTVINSASVRITNGKVTITLGTPKASNSDMLNNLNFKIPSDVNISYFLGEFWTSDRNYLMMCQSSVTNADVGLMYVSKDTTVTQENTTVPTTMSLRQGWNFIIWGENTYATTTLPGGYQWKINGM